MSRRPQVTVPEPYEDVKSLRTTVMAIKELVEILAGQRGQAYDVGVTWGDLLSLGVVTPDQIPRDIGSRPIKLQPK